MSSRYGGPLYQVKRADEADGGCDGDDAVSRLVGQSITIDSGANQETATIALVQGGRGGARVTVTAPLKMVHPAGTPLAGSGITLTTPFARAHAAGAVVTTDLLTPGSTNKYSNARAVR